MNQPLTGLSMWTGLLRRADTLALALWLDGEVSSRGSLSLIESVLMRLALLPPLLASLLGRRLGVACNTQTHTPIRSDCQDSEPLLQMINTHVMESYILL